MTLTIELTEEEAASLAARAASAGKPVGEYVHSLVSGVPEAELARRRSWAAEVQAIRDRTVDASDLDVRELIEEGRN